MRSLFQYHGGGGGPDKKRKFRHRHTQRGDKVKTQEERAMHKPRRRTGTDLPLALRTSPVDTFNLNF